MNTLLFKDNISDFSKTLGFDDCRVTDPFLNNEYLTGYQTWLTDNNHGDMTYLADHLRFKENPNLLLPNIQSAIVLIKNYKNTPTRRLDGNFKIARYAVGRDYHSVMKEKMDRVIEFIKKEDPTIECYAGVDSRPIAERSLALKAGIGFLGKNTMVIKPGLGSYFFIGIILTTAKLEEDQPLKWDCGQCRLCLDACPTNALTPFKLNATKCISYLTIEQKTPLTDEEIQKNNGWIYGCDVCQEVCPYNADRIPLSSWKEFHPQEGVGFDFFKKDSLEEQSIPKYTPLYRSRKRIIPNWNKARDLLKSP